MSTGRRVVYIEEAAIPAKHLFGSGASRERLGQEEERVCTREKERYGAFVREGHDAYKGQAIKENIRALIRTIQPEHRYEA